MPGVYPSRLAFHWKPSLDLDPYIGRTHGRTSTYNAGCRCDDCRAAATKRRARYPHRAGRRTAPMV